MSMEAPMRGAAPVGLVDDLGPVESSAVYYLRLWCDGPDAQQSIQDDFVASLGQENGSRLAKNFSTLCEVYSRQGRRSLVRHDLGCKCVGADEACFANFIGYASEGEREDAILLASTAVTPSYAPLLVSLAQDFGLALRRMSLRRQSCQRIYQAPVDGLLH